MRRGGAVRVLNTTGVDDGDRDGPRGHEGPAGVARADRGSASRRCCGPHCFDGVVCIPNCDKIVPGMLMGIARVNIPAVFVSGGPMKAGKLPSSGKAIDLATVFEGVGQVAAGKITLGQLAEIEEHACPTCGSCSGMFTANSMNCLCDGSVPRLPGNGSILATDPGRDRLFQAAGRAIVELVKKDIKPRDILTRAAFNNAFALDVAMGGSTNTVLHTLAIAIEAARCSNRGAAERDRGEGAADLQSRAGGQVSHGGRGPLGRDRRYPEDDRGQAWCWIRPASR